MKPAVSLTLSLLSPSMPCSLSGEPPTPPRAFTLTLPHRGFGATAGGSSVSLSSFVFHYLAMVVGCLRVLLRLTTELERDWIYLGFLLHILSGCGFTLGSSFFRLWFYR
jgi:hypothetical protein